MIGIDIGKNSIRAIAGDTERSFVLWRKLSRARVVARLAIEYIFHVTLMLAGVILAYFFLTLQGRSAAA